MYVAMMHALPRDKGVKLGSKDFTLLTALTSFDACQSAAGYSQ